MKAIVSTIHTLAGESAPRRLFASSETGYSAPLLEQAVGIGSVVLMAVALPFVVLLALLFWGARAARRLADRRLIESA